MNKTVVIYHGNCFDGICAAWVVHRYLSETELDTNNWEFIPANYGDNKLMTNIQQDCYENANINDNYILVDFSFPRDLMEQMYNKAKSMIVLDHHKTAQAACEGLPFCKFDMNESGASLVWKHFFSNEEMPLLVRYIKDRDLWLFKETESEAINAFIQSYPMKLSAYDRLNDLLEDEFESVLVGGQAILRYINQKVDQIITSTTRMTDVAGYIVPVAVAPILMSEVGNELCKRYPNAPFACYNFKRSDGVIQWGARSIGDFDVSEIAKRYGGGGHKNAAGWQDDGNN